MPSPLICGRLCPSPLSLSSDAPRRRIIAGWPGHHASGAGRGAATSAIVRAGRGCRQRDGGIHEISWRDFRRRMTIGTRLFTWWKGELVGTDELANRYYREKGGR